MEGQLLVLGAWLHPQLCSGRPPCTACVPLLKVKSPRLREAESLSPGGPAAEPGGPARRRERKRDRDLAEEISHPAALLQGHLPAQRVAPNHRS